MTCRIWPKVGVPQVLSLQYGNVREFASATSGKLISKALSTAENGADEVAEREIQSTTSHTSRAKKRDEQTTVVSGKVAEKPAIGGRRTAWNKKTDEQKALIMEKRRAARASLRDERRAFLFEKQSIAMRAVWANRTPEERAALTAKYVANLTKKKTPEELAAWKARQIAGIYAYEEAMTDEEKSIRASKYKDASQRYWASLTDEQRANESEGRSAAAWWQRSSLPKILKEESTVLWEATTPEQRAIITEEIYRAGFRAGLKYSQRNSKRTNGEK